MVLTNGTSWYYSQPFRKATPSNDPEPMQYLGMPFNDGSGFIQTGMGVERIVASISEYANEDVMRTKIGDTGFVAFFDPFADRLPKGVKDGTMVEISKDG